MKDIVVYLRVERYIKQWLENALGNPVRFPARSYENELLHRLLSRRPQGVQPRLVAEPEEVAIVIPDRSDHKPEYYNYLSRRSQTAMVCAIDGLFRLALWSECAPLIGSTAGLNAGIDEWCCRQGIDLDSREAVRQKFYRMRKTYRLTGIVLGKTYGKQSPLTPSKK